MQFLWSCSEKESYQLLDTFFEAGGNFLDTADMYSQWVKGLAGGESETILGNWIKNRKARNKIFLATKVRCKMWEGPDGEGLSKAHILKASEASLMRLKTDFIDLYQSHWPDPKTPIEETLEAYKILIEQGKVRFIGCSNYSKEELEEAIKIGKEMGVSYISVQPHYSLIQRYEFEKNILSLVLKEKMAVLPYSPLEGGFLTGKYRKDQPLPKSVRAQTNKEKMSELNLKVIEALEKIAKKYGKTVAQIALAWLLSCDWITAPIIGATTVEQLKENLGASGLKLEKEDKAILEQLTQNGQR